jgi:putative membrane protein
VNAALNATSAALLVAGWRAIRAGDRDRHRRRMLGAFLCSGLFLCGYLVRLALTGTHRFPGTGWPRTAYLALLGVHTVLAAAALPLVLVTLARALGERFEAHRRVARLTLPIWLTVSATGVLVYVGLYWIAPALR